MKRVLITGANGFIGARLLSRLIGLGYEPAIIVRDSSNLKRIGHLLDKTRVFHGDVRDAAGITAIMAEFAPEAVIHLVTYYAVEHTTPEIRVMLDTNVTGTVNLLEAARLNHVRLFVNTSTCAVYEQKDLPVSEQAKISPQNLYAVTKLQAEEACRFYANNYGVDAITLRLFPPYGPGDNERRLIPYLIKTFAAGSSPQLTTGKQKWDFVYVDDIVEAFVAVLARHPFREHYDVINIGTGDPVSVRDMVLLIMQTMGKDLPLAWGAVPHRKNEVWLNSADCHKAAEVLGWKPATKLDAGIRNTIGYFTGKGPETP